MVEQLRQLVDTIGDTSCHVLATCMLVVLTYHLISRHCGSYGGVCSHHDVTCCGTAK